MDFPNKTILMTEWVDGTDTKTIRKFIASGASLVVCGRNEISLQILRSNFADAKLFLCDISDEAGQKSLKDKVQLWGGIDVLYHNAASLQSRNWELTSPKENLGLELLNTYISIVHLNELFIPGLETKQHPFIVHDFSVPLNLPPGIQSVFSAAKQAFDSYTGYLRRQLEFNKSKIMLCESFSEVYETIL